MQRKYIPFFVFALLLASILVGSDYATSEVPGWHTTIYPPLFFINIILSVFVLVATLGYLRLARKIVNINWTVFITHLMLTIPATILMKFPVAFLFLSASEPERLIMLEAQLTTIAYCLFIVGQIFFAIYYFKTKRLIENPS